MMTSKRQAKVSRLLLKELSYLFQSDSKKFTKDKMKLISITNVRITPDLEIAKVYISIFPPENNNESLKAIQTSTKTIRYDLGIRIKNQVKKIPSLQFFIDDSLDYVNNIDNLLHKR